MGPINVNIDFSALAQLIVDAIVSGIQHLVSPLPFSFEEWLIHSIQSILTAQGANNLLTHIPTEWTSQNPDVLRLWRDGLVANLGLAAVVLAIQGYRVMHGQVDLWEAVFRTGFFVIAGQGMALWGDWILHAINAAADGVGASPLDIRRENMPNDLVLGMMLAIALFCSVLAWIKGAVGVVFIDVLIVSAPYLLTLSALPVLNGLGRWWVEEFTTWALRPFMVALVLRLGLGVGLFNSGGAQLLFAIVAFWLAWTMDSRLRRFSVGAWGSISQLALLKRGAAMTAGAFGGGVVAGAAGAAASTAAAAAPATP